MFGTFILFMGEGVGRDLSVVAITNKPKAQCAWTREFYRYSEAGRCTPWEIAMSSTTYVPVHTEFSLIRQSGHGFLKENTQLYWLQKANTGLNRFHLFLGAIMCFDHSFVNGPPCLRHCHCCPNHGVQKPLPCLPVTSHSLLPPPCHFNEKMSGYAHVL